MGKGITGIFIRFILLGSGLFISHMLFIWPGTSGVLFGEMLLQSWTGWFITYGAFLLSIIGFNCVFSSKTSRAGILLAFVLICLLGVALYLVSAEKQESVLSFQKRLAGARAVSMEQSFSPGELYYFPQVALVPGTTNTAGWYHNSLLYHSNGTDARLYMDASIQMHSQHWELQQGYQAALSDLTVTRITENTSVNIDKDKAFATPMLTFELPGADADSFLERLISWQRNIDAERHPDTISLEFGIFLAGLIFLSFGVGWIFRDKSRELDYWLKGWLAYALLVIVPVFLINISWKMLLATHGSAIIFWLRAALTCIIGAILLGFCAFRPDKSGRNTPQQSGGHND